MSSRWRRKLTAVALGLVAAWLSGGVGRAQEAAIQCPTTVPVGEELRNPPELRAQGGVLNTKFQVQIQQQCVPVATTTNNTTTWAYQAQSLRTYVYPDPQTGRPHWGFPGPTLHIRKSEEVPTPGKPTVKLGDRLKVLLVNDLEPDKPGPGGCNNACPASTVCPAESELPTQANCAGATPSALCCCWVNVNQHWPDCFHGDNTTNLHFHGTHVSPQAPQDYVLLELRPRPKKGAEADKSHPAHERGVVAYGEYQYNVDPPPPTQAEGTHWYHPHKHGSVSLQVANGMPGALIIEGAFDDWLRNYYHGHLAEKLLVIQQVQQSTNLFTPGAPAPTPLINGQVTPKVTMKPGEVQRWRFVNATMQVASQISINFPSGVTVKQMAMDGVRFAPENYDRQPLFDPAHPKLFKVSPGNRADFLVQAPLTPGTYHVRHRVIGNLSANTQRRLQLREQALRSLSHDQSNDAEASGPDLLTLVVEAPKPQPKGKKAAAVATGFPTVAQWPKMPWYLRDLPNKVEGQQNLTFAMTSEPSGQPAGPGDPTAIFTINGIQYNDKCVNITTKLNSVEEWTVKNSSALKHPFHIHTNPFQVINDGTTAFKPPYVWQDTIALPAGTPQALGSVELRHRYLEFTGEYVLHCHFLGHEDRGMMFGVQTVCKDDPTHYGKSKPYGQPECVPGNLIPAATQCSTTGSSTATGSASGGEHEH